MTMQYYIGKTAQNVYLSFPDAWTCRFMLESKCYPETKRQPNAMKQNPATRSLKYLFNNPFARGKSQMIFHTSHHKVGTSWFRNILQAVAEEFGLRFVKDDPALISGKPLIYFQHRPAADPATLDHYRGSHMIRDPRDVVISGYHYHLWTQESWAITPIQELPANMEKAWPLLPIREIGHMSYQEYLKSLPKEEGILAEIKRASTGTIREMVTWDYGNPAIFEIKYEAIIKDEENIFRQMFSHYGFKNAAIEKSCAIAEKFSFKNRAKRHVGSVKSESHLRSGKPRQWETEFTPALRDYFKQLHGQDLIDLGYEKDLSW